MQRFAHARLVLASFVLLFLPCGCRSTMGPKMPQGLAPSLMTYSQSDFKGQLNDYQIAIKAGQLTQAQTIRNAMAYRIMADIESGYSGFEMRLTTQRAGFETGADAVQLGVTAATTLVPTGDIKDILAASLSAFQGTRLSIDKNFFREKTTESLISQMRASRKNKQAQLIQSLANRDVTSYPWEAVWVDLVDFYYAGTVPSALVEIANNSGVEAKAAAANLDAVINDQAKQAISVRSAYEKLQTQIASSDAQKVTAAEQTLRAILVAAGYQPAADAKPADLLTQFRQAMRDADPDADPTGAKLKALNSAIAANLK